MGRLTDDIRIAMGIKPAENSPKMDFKTIPQKPISEEDSPSNTTMQVPEDCFSCRVIALTTTFGLIGLIGYACYRNPKKYTGKTLFMFRAQGVVGSIALSDLVYQRVTNTRLFDPDKKEFSMMDHLQCDSEDFAAYVKSFFKD